MNYDVRDLCIDFAAYTLHFTPLFHLFILLKFNFSSGTISETKV